MEACSRLAAMLIVVTVLSGIGSAVQAAPSNEMQQLRSEMAAMRSDYEARINALESRLDAALANNPVESPPPTVLDPPLPEAAVTARGNEFNPATSLILTGSYGQLSRNPANYRIGGFIPAGGETGPPGRGARLGESELTLSASIDPYFSGYFVGAFNGDEGTSVEEAYITHVGLIPGGTLRLGRFLSEFGYHNAVHAHAWDFIDAPLALQAFLGGARTEDGVQVRWIAPTPLLIELGVELGLGDQFPGTNRSRNGANGLLAFARLGGDIGFSNSYRIGATVYRSKAVQRGYDDVESFSQPVTNLFTGDTRMWGLDVVWKWAPDGNTADRNFKFQAEYFHRDEDGELEFDAGRPVAAVGSYHSEQSGWYAQAVYQFVPRWRFGARYDALDSGNTGIGLVQPGSLSAADFPLLGEHDPRRITAMVDFSPSEFSRLRLQYAWDKARFNGTDDQLLLQYIVSLGSHGAHKF